MADKIFRSGAPHAVETNPVTRNAVLPRHELQATDPLQTERAVAPPSDGEAPLTHSNHLDQAVAQPAAQYRDAKSHLSENRQGLDATSLQDNLQGVGGSEHIQEDIRYHEKKNWVDRWHKLPEATPRRLADVAGTSTSFAQADTHAAERPTAPLASQPPAGEAPVPTDEPVFIPREADTRLRDRLDQARAKVRQASELLDEIESEKGPDDAS